MRNGPLHGLCTGLDHDAAKRTEQLRDTMNLVQHDQTVLILAEKEDWLDSFSRRSFVLQIQIKCSGCESAISRPGWFSNLPRPMIAQRCLLRACSMSWQQPGESSLYIMLVMRDLQG